MMRTVAIVGDGGRGVWQPDERDAGSIRLLTAPSDWAGPPPTGQPVAWLADADAIYIGGPLAGRAGLALGLAHVGKPLFVEQPLAPSRAEAERLTAAAHAAGATIIPVATLRQQPFAISVQHALRQGSLGRVRYGQLTLLQGEPPEPHPAAASQSTPADFPLAEVAAALDLLSWFVDSAVSSVFARGCDLGAADPGPGAISISLRFADGAQVMCEVGRAPGLAAGLQRLHLIGELGALWHDSSRGDLVLGGHGAGVLIDHPLAGVMAEVAQALADPAAPASLPLDDCYRSLALAAAVRTSLRLGQPVAVGGDPA